MPKSRRPILPRQKRCALEKDLADALKDVPKAVAFLVFKQLGQRQPFKFDSSTSADFETEVESAVDHKFIDIDSQGRCNLVERSPKIKRIDAAFWVLHTFLDGEVEELAEAFEDEHDTLLELDNRQYWEIRLDPRIKKVYE